MADFDFNEIKIAEVDWPKRGRKPKPLPEGLKAALLMSYTEGKVANMVMPNAQIYNFANLLTKAGKELNMRIERHIEKDKPEPGLSTYHFRVRSKRNKEIADV